MAMQLSNLGLVAILIAIAACADSAPNWNDLRVTWGPNPSKSFYQQPRTVADAESKGFKRVGSGKCNGTLAYNGVAYVKDNDFALTLLYDVNGYIAGIQHGITKELANKTGFPTKRQQPPFVYVEGRYVISVYFTEPSKICTVGRTKEQFEAQGTGIDLWIQMGNMSRDVVRMPTSQSDLTKTKWTEGKCFVTMGKHYWYDVTPDMDCEDFLPVFLLYNGGRLNAFGWVMMANLPSPHYEHPGVSVIGAFMKEVPKCVQHLTQQLSTMHIYLSSMPWFDHC